MHSAWGRALWKHLGPLLTRILELKKQVRSSMAYFLPPLSRKHGVRCTPTPPGPALLTPAALFTGSCNRFVLLAYSPFPVSLPPQLETSWKVGPDFFSPSCILLRPARVPGVERGRSRIGDPRSTQALRAGPWDSPPCSHRTGRADGGEGGARPKSCPHS